MNNRTIHDLNEAVRKLNEIIVNTIEFLGGRRDAYKVSELPLTTHDLDEAIKDLNKLILADSNDPILYINRGNAYFYICDYEEAISDYGKFIQICPENAKAYLIRGYVHSCKKEYDKAIKDYSKAIDINCEYAEAYYARSEAHDRKGESDRACFDSAKAHKLGFDLQTYIEDSNLELIDDLVQLCPRNAKVHYYRGLIHDCSGDYNLAIADYSESIRLDCKFSDAYHDRGKVYYYGAYEKEKAIADYTEAIRLYDAYGGRRAEALCDRGMVYESKETIDGYSKAIEDYELSGRLQHNCYQLALDVYFKRGALHAEVGNYDSAISDMSRIIELDDSIGADYDEAFRRGPEYDPDSFSSSYGSIPAGQAYNNRGIYYSKKGKYNLAISDLTEILRIYNERVELTPESNPDFATIYLNLGSINQANGDYDRAIGNYDNVVRLCPNYATDFIESKFAHGGQDAVETAIELLEGRINSHPRNPGDFYYTGVLALFSNDGTSAQRAFQIALRHEYDDKEKLDRHLANLNNRK